MKQLGKRIKASGTKTAFFCHRHHRKNLQGLLICKIIAIILFSLSIPNLVFSENQAKSNNITVKGKVRLPAADQMPEKGLNLSLIHI